MILIALLSFSGASYAGTLSLESGYGIRIAAVKSNDYQQAALNLKLDHGYVFSEYRFGTLNGSAVGSAALGLTTKGRIRLMGSIGGAYLGTVPVELTGHEQFIISLGAEYDLTDRTVLSLQARHYSNGSRLFGHGRVPNRGVDAIFMGIGVRF